MKNKILITIILTLISILSLCSACSLNEQDTITVKVGLTYNWYQGEDYVYSSSNENIATVDEFGVITGISFGECTVTARTIGSSKSVKVSVIKNAMPSYPSSIPSYTTGKSSSSFFIESSSSSSSIITSSSKKDSSSSSIITSSSVITSPSSSKSSSSLSSISSAPTIMFTLNCNGGSLTDNAWVKNNDVYITYSANTLPTPEKVGYEFLGWENTSGKVTAITSGGSAYAVWKELTYQVEYVLYDGENNPNNPSFYSYFDEPFTLLPATHSSKDFIGWFLDEDFSQETLVIPNTKQKVTLYAKYSTTFTATYHYNGLEYPITVEEGKLFTKPNIQIDNGYFIEWFTEETLENNYNFALIPTKDISLYGKLYTELTSSFFGYENNKLTKVNNMTEFQYYLEYTYFNNITSDNAIELSQDVYNTLTTSSTQEISLILNKATVPFISLQRSSWVSGGKYYYQVLSTVGVPDSFYTQTLSTIPQYDYAQLGQDNSFVATRPSNFDNFKYQELSKTVSVSNSNQLFFALEHRLKPIPVENSNAEIALNKCKNILRNIINDDMSDEEKVLRIYRYLCYLVTYNLPSSATSDNSLLYDAFYAEGVLNNGQAVCDGICKTVSLLCNIEGIRCVRTASTSHAWNEVFVNGNWFTLDVTHGNLCINDQYEVLTHDNFLINETIKESKGYTDILRTEIVADGNYNYYKENTFTYDNQTYDFVIESRTELIVLYKWCAEQDELYDYSEYTVDVLIDYSYSNISTELSYAKSSAGLYGTSIGYVPSTFNGYNHYVFIFK